MDYSNLNTENAVKVVGCIRNGSIDGKAAYRVTLAFGEDDKPFHLDITTLKEYENGYYNVRPCVKFALMPNGKKKPYASFRLGEKVKYNG